jgi:hypothetical protein
MHAAFCRQLAEHHVVYLAGTSVCQTGLASLAWQFRLLPWWVAADSIMCCFHH